jgi:hypothetical protein
MTIKKSTLKKAGAILGGLFLISLFVLVAGPVISVDAAEDTCGNGVCDLSTENNDLCPEDCQCIDNGVEDPGEGCNCKDVICDGEGEDSGSACGTYVGPDGECPGNLVNSGGVCWDRCECEGICGDTPEPAPAPAGKTCVPAGECNNNYPTWDCCGNSRYTDGTCSSGWRCGK